MSLIEKVGLYAGTFDPVHEGHVSLMKQSIEELGLDMIYCLPDRFPPHKSGATDFIHRQAMLRQAVYDIPQVRVFEVSTDYATFPDTIDELGLVNSEVYILMGSDAAVNIGQWHNSQQMMEQTKLLVGVRGTHDEENVESVFRQIGIDKERYKYIKTPYADLSSSQVRGQQQQFHPRVVDYIRKHRLYKV